MNGLITKIQVTIEALEAIIANAKEKKQHDSSLSNTIEIELVEGCPFHTGSDRLRITQKSSYAECSSSYLDTIY